MVWEGTQLCWDWVFFFFFLRKVVENTPKFSTFRFFLKMQLKENKFLTDQPILFLNSIWGKHINFFFGLRLNCFSPYFSLSSDILPFIMMIHASLCCSFCRLSELGQHVGVRILDLLFIREKGLKRETKLLNILLFIKSNVWKVCIEVFVSK